MANTEGLPDEALSTLLTLSQDDVQTSTEAPLSSGRRDIISSNNLEAPRFPRKYLARREQMMELGEGEAPAAKVIRSSRPPAIRSSVSLNKISGGGTPPNTVTSSHAPADQSPTDTQSSVDGCEFQDTDNVSKIENNCRPVILAENIRERSINHAPEDLQQRSTTGRVKISKFKQRNLNKYGAVPPTSGFPSLDLAPVGCLTRKGRGGQAKDSQNAYYPKKVSSTPDAPKSIVDNSEHACVQRAADSMLANMSLEEIQDGIDEIKSILSPASIKFLQNRSQNKTKQPLTPIATPNTTVTMTALSKNPNISSKEAEIKIEEQNARKEKEETAQILSSVLTPEDMDEAYDKALSLGLATELPASTLPTYSNGLKGENNDDLNDITMLTSLLRSTALRQRLLGIKGLYNILEAKVDSTIQTRRLNSYTGDKNIFPEETDCPPLLPVALRCLLDDSIGISHTAVGCRLLSLTLRCIHCLLMICVHPHHLICADQSINKRFKEDPFFISLACFMSEISHIPAGSDLYPPATIKPLGDEGFTTGCYRSDSSAASAESDSKAFYSDPAWTLLSRMRIIPCLSDALKCTSKYCSLDPSMPSETIIRNICGILTLLSMRSPGVAGAIAGHKVLLPLLISSCLSPNTNTTPDTSIFRVDLALPALKLMCILAQQSQDIAKLGSFTSIIPDIQAFLCLESPNEQEAELQSWSLIMIRILLRYGIATEHTQSLIQFYLSATQIALGFRNDIYCQYYAVFSRLCDLSKADPSQIPNEKLEVIKEQESEDSLVLIGVWLASTATSIAQSFVISMGKCDSVSTKEQMNMKLAASELQFLSSYAIATSPSNSNPVREEMKASFVPSITMESCNEVHNAVMNSDLFEFALDVALKFAFCENWHTSQSHHGNVLEREAEACLFVNSFMKFHSVVEQSVLVRGDLTSAIYRAMEKARTKNRSFALVEDSIHPARKNWFISSEFSILKFLCNKKTLGDTSLVRTFAFSLLGRLEIGDEALANFIFSHGMLFEVDASIKGVSCKHLSSGTFLQSALLGELQMPDERKIQLNHSLALHSTTVQTLSLSTRAGQIKRAENTFLLPLGGIWLWNVLSSTTTDSVAVNEQTQSIQRTLNIVSHALALAMSLEFASPGSNINNGTKLYHIANVCLYPEVVLQEEFVQSAVTLLYGQFVTAGNSSDLVRDFISACHHHSRLSRTKIKSGDVTEVSIAKVKVETGAISAEECSALDDFVGDMCDCYIEYGAQYNVFTKIIRFLLRYEIPGKITCSILSKLYPILNVLTIDEDRDETYSALIQSVSGGLPSIDGSRRDCGDLLDSFSDALRKRDKELSRGDYIYLLAISVLSRNLSSGLQRCECGVEAMKHRLLGIRESVFYDIYKISGKFLFGNGSKESLINCVMDVCLNDDESLMKQPRHVQLEWNWDEKNKQALWNKAISSLNKAKTDTNTIS